MASLEYVEVNPAAEATAAVIWMHGLGADGNDFVPVLPALGLPKELAIRFIFPHAPMRNVTVNGGMPMRAWFDVYKMGAERDINSGHLIDVSESVKALILAQENLGIAAERIILIGFSQGGAVGYQTALRYDKPLGGLAALSTYRINPEAATSVPAETNKKLPVLVNHGDWDGVVTKELGYEAYESLLGQGLDATWKTYPMDHEVTLTQMQDLGVWIQSVLK